MSGNDSPVKRNRLISKKLIIVLVLIFAVVLAAGATYWINSREDKKAENGLPTIAPPVPRNDPDAGKGSIKVFPVPPEDAGGDKPKLPGTG